MTFILYNNLLKFVVYGGPNVRKSAYKPPDEESLNQAREERLKEIKMYAIIREILFYSLFLWILMVVSYNFRDPYAFKLKTVLTHQFDDQGLEHIDTFYDALSKVFFSYKQN